MKLVFGCSAFVAVLFVAFPGLPATTNRPNFRLFTEKVPSVEGGSITNHVLIVGAERFSFVPPARWSIKYNPETKTALLLEPNLEAGVSLRIDLAEQAAAAPNAEQVRKEIQARYPGAKGLRSHHRPVAGADCYGYEFELKRDKNAVTSFRVMHVPFKKGSLQIEMKAAAKKFANYDQTFAAFLSSLRIQ